MNLLALDQATQTGWAAFADGKVAHSFVTMPRGERTVGKFAAKWRGFLIGLLDEYRPELVVFEAPFITPTLHQMTARKLHALSAITEMVCHDRNIYCQEATPSAVRHWFIGANPRREEAKKATIEECRRRGWQPVNDDEADALALLSFVAQANGLDVPWAQPRTGPLL